MIDSVMNLAFWFTCSWHFWQKLLGSGNRCKPEMLTDPHFKHNCLTCSF